jgi:sulfate transport system ATP-binding protein
MVVGANARLELEREDKSGIIEAEISSELFHRLGLREGESLLARPSRMKVFLDPTDWISP